MKKSNIYYNAVFKNNQLRDCARKAATNLLISLDDLKQENIDINTKSISEYDDFDQNSTVALLRYKHKEKMRLNKFKLISEYINDHNLHSSALCNCETPKQSKSKNRLQPLYTRQNIHNNKIFQAENKKTPGISEEVCINRGGSFITETQEPKFNRKLENKKTQNSEKTFSKVEIPKINTNNATFINSSSIEELKSYRLVSCRQKLRELTDTRFKSLMNKQNK